MTSYLWRKYADYLHEKGEKMIFWDMMEPYRRPKSFTPLVCTYICAFYTGVIGAAITEQLYKSYDLLSLGMEYLGDALPLHRRKLYDKKSQVEDVNKGEILGRTPWGRSSHNEANVLWGPLEGI